MSKRQQVKRDVNREMEILTTPVRSDGVGEDKVIQDLLSDKFVTAPDREAFPIALALQELIRGQASVLANQKDLSDELNAMRTRMDAYDRDKERWETDRVKFLEEIESKAESLRITDPMKKAKFEGEQAKTIENAMTMAKANAATNKVAFEQLLARMPKVKVISPGKVETIQVGDSLTTRIVPIEVRIKNHVWRLEPGVETEVPLIVKEQLEQKNLIRQEAKERKDALELTNGLMTGKNEIGQVLGKWKKIDEKYKVETDYEGA